MKSNDILNVNLELIDNSIEKITNNVYSKYKENISSLESILNNSIVEGWISDSSLLYQSELKMYIEKMNIISKYYCQIISDLKKIKLELEIEMNKKTNVHFEW